MIKKNLYIVSGLLVFVFVLYIYILTLAPTIWFIDSGELASVAITLGIGHPTGYPLFTLIGHLFSWIPIGTEIYRMNLLSSVFCALGIFMMLFLMVYLLGFYKVMGLTENVKAKKTSASSKQTGKGKSLPQNIFIAVIIFTSLILAFSRTYWDAANSVEVYPLHVFFIVTLLLIFLNAILGTRKDSGPEIEDTFLRKNRYYILFAFVLGLSFSNHLTTILLAPACLTLFFVENHKNMKYTFKLIGVMAIFFIIAFSAYLYLPIRASENPTFIWGNPVTFEKFRWHITGKQFQVWIFSGKGSLAVFISLLIILITLCVIGLKKYKTISPTYHYSIFPIMSIITFFILNSSTETVSKQFNHFFGSLVSEYGFAVIILAIPGVFYLSRYNIKLFYFTILTFFGCVIYSVNYDIHDIDSYFLLSYITLAVWIGFGGLFLYDLLSNYLNTKPKQTAFAVLLVLISILGLKMNYEGNDESKNYKVQEYTMNIFMNAQPNSIIISSQWDFWLAASWYYHFVKNQRTDIVVIDKELLRRSWYFKFLEQNYPEVYNNSRQEIDKFMVELYKFEHDIPYDQYSIVKLFEEMLTSFVKNNPDRKVYTTWEIEQNKNEVFAREYARIPDGLLFRLVKSDTPDNKKIIDYTVYDFKFTPIAMKNYYDSTLMQTYSGMLTASATILANEYKRIDDAKKYVDLALLATPNNTRALDLKRKLSQ